MEWWGGDINRGMVSGWWNDFYDIYSGVSDRGMREELVRVVRDGKDTDTWSDKWVGESSLKYVFHKLFRLCSKQEGKVREFGILWWGGGDWKWELPWRRPLRVRESIMANEFLNSLNSTL